MSVFKGSDIVEFAVRIEENGENFYRYAVQLAKDEETKTDLPESCRGRGPSQEDLRENLRRPWKRTFLPETYDGEYAAYMHNYVDNNIIFNKEVMDKELANVKDILSAIDFAIAAGTRFHPLLP